MTDRHEMDGFSLVLVRLVGGLRVGSGLYLSDGHDRTLVALQLTLPFDHSMFPAALHSTLS